MPPLPPSPCPSGLSWVFLPCTTLPWGDLMVLRLWCTGLTPRVQIKEKFAGDLHVTFSGNNAEKLILRLRLINHDDKDAAAAAIDDEVFLKKVEATMLQDIALKGIPDIRKVFLRESTRSYITPAGSFDKQKEVRSPVPSSSSPLRFPLSALRFSPLSAHIIPPLSGARSRGTITARSRAYVCCLLLAAVCSRVPERGGQPRLRLLCPIFAGHQNRDCPQAAHLVLNCTFVGPRGAAVGARHGGL